MQVSGTTRDHGIDPNGQKDNRVVEHQKFVQGDFLDVEKSCRICERERRDAHPQMPLVDNEAQNSRIRGTMFPECSHAQPPPWSHSKPSSQVTFVFIGDSASLVLFRSSSAISRESFNVALSAKSNDRKFLHASSDEAVDFHLGFKNLYHKKQEIKITLYLRSFPLCLSRKPVVLHRYHNGEYRVQGRIPSGSNKL